MAEKGLDLQGDGQNTDEIRVTDFSLEELLPHRRPMLLLDEALEGDRERAVSRSRVAPSWPMASEEGVDPLICVELAAQTAGICNGYDRIRSWGADSDQMGWLVAVKRADFFITLLPFGMEIRASAENTMVFDKFREVTSRIYHGDEVIAEVVLQLYQP